MMYTRVFSGLLVSTLALAGARGDGVVDKTEGEPSKAPAASIQIWPRRPTVCLPTGLEQFVFVELTHIRPKSALHIRLALPPGVTVKDFPEARGWACLPPNLLYPTAWRQKGQLAELDFPADIIPSDREKSSWLALTVAVNTAPGEYEMTIDIKDGNASIVTKTFAVKIYPKLSEKTPENLKILVFQYSGLKYKYVPTYVNMLRAAGVNLFMNMHGDGAKNGEGVSDYIESQGLGLALAMFTKKIESVRKHYADEFEGIRWDETWLMEHPEVLKKVIGKYVGRVHGERRLDSLIYDAESSSFRKGKIVGDLSPFSLETFRAFAGIPADVALTPERIAEDYVKQWIEFRCHQSTQFAEIMREFLDEKYPNASLGVYSGYEFDEPPHKDRTRMLYSVDWKSMANTGLDFGSAGYGGNMDQIQNTAGALSGKAPFIPGEMYLVNFLTKANRANPPEAWAMRLITAFVNSGMKGGLAIWYGNDLDGSAMISINMAVEFIRKVEQYAVKGKRDDTAVVVSPATEKDNVRVLRQGGNALIIATNDDATEKVVRVRLQGFTLKGFAGEVEITDVVTGESIEPKKVLTVRIEPYNYRLLTLMDDGN